MKTILVPVTFNGVIEVQVRDSVPIKRQKALATRLALARVLATIENGDAPEDEAFEEYQTEFKLSDNWAGKEWDGCEILGISGEWTEGSK